MARGPEVALSTEVWSGGAVMGIIFRLFVIDTQAGVLNYRYSERSWHIITVVIYRYIGYRYSAHSWKSQ